MEAGRADRSRATEVHGRSRLTRGRRHGHPDLLPQAAEPGRAGRGLGLGHLWREKPVTWDNGEDIHFSAMAKIHGGVRTYCPPHPPDDRELHGSIRGFELGADDKATHLGGGDFGAQRNACVLAALEKGWETVRHVTR
jgi:hypothetical protein